MHSGTNSASLQSSSGGGGGDDEYDSRASESFNSSAFHTQQNSSSSMFDPFANYFNPISRPQPPPHNYTTTNSLFYLDTDWSKTLRSDHNNNPMLVPSSNKSSSFGDVSFPSAPAQHGGSSVGVTATNTRLVAQSTPPADQPIVQPARNPKKRSRASRRAPTTVLTTDTSNFRAMVQEFTGIPEPPFTSYFPPRTRFDIFASAAPNNSVANNPLNISQPSNYLRRSFPQKIQPPHAPFLSPNSSTSLSSSSSSLMLSCLANNIACGSSSTTSASNSNINYQLSGGVASSVTQSSNNLFSTIQQNSMLTSLLQSSQKYPLGGSKDQEQFQMPSNSSHMKIGSVLEEYSMNNAQHGHLLSGLPNLISPEQATASSSRNENSIIGASSTNFHGDNKVQETVASRGSEVMVESWICSSD